MQNTCHGTAFSYFLQDIPIGFYVVGDSTYSALRKVNVSLRNSDGWPYIPPDCKVIFEAFRYKVTKGIDGSNFLGIFPRFMWPYFEHCDT
jgi:hypothetical protein